MDDRNSLLNKLRLAEQQFRLACTVNLAVANNEQLLDVPLVWAYGTHSVSYEDFGLRVDQAEVVAPLLEMTATFVVAAAIRDVMIGCFQDPKNDNDQNVVAAYQISRMLRNAFSHSMLSPKWSIDEDCKDQEFSIAQIISLNTTGLHGKIVHWRDYGGPLAIFKFGRHVRETLLGDKIDPLRIRPARPTTECYQQGRLILKRVGSIPAAAAEVPPGKILDLGNGYRIQTLLRSGE
jgi:hypothetical protein